MYLPMSLPVPGLSLISSIDQIESSSSFASPAELSHRSIGQVSVGCTPGSPRAFEFLLRERISHSKVFSAMSVCEVELKRKGTRGVVIRGECKKSYAIGPFATQKQDYDFPHHLLGLEVTYILVCVGW